MYNIRNLAKEMLAFDLYFAVYTLLFYLDITFRLCLFLVSWIINVKLILKGMYIFKYIINYKANFGITRENL